MPTVTLAAADDFDGWRAAVRGLVGAGIAPADVVWQVAGAAGDLFAETATVPPVPPSFTIPRAFIEIARRVICNADPERFALLHRVLLALRDRPALLDDSADALVNRLYLLDKAVRRDVHKMRAFVRFREVADAAGERFVAWFEPEHHIVRLNSGFFSRRFAQMRFSILTPDLCMHWDGELTFSPGAVKADAPDGDPLEATWKTYYANIFNPARLMVGAMTKEMPKKYWKNMPETALIPDLIAGAANRTRGMIAAGGEPGAPPSIAAPVSGPGGDASIMAGTASSAAAANFAAMAALRVEANACTRCPLYLPATQTVFGEGPTDAVLVFVGEQPGDQEDLAGRPFVGPAGQVFDRALAAAGIDRAGTYVTNAVKHFKFEPRGKRRIHAKPGGPEIEACRWWIDRELAIVAPKVTVALGATAARSLTGKTVTIARERGRAIARPDGSELWITVHPSFLLRIEDRAAAEAEFERFVGDLVRVKARVVALP